MEIGCISIAIMPTDKASTKDDPSIWVFKLASIPFSELLAIWNLRIEARAVCLPTDSLVKMS